MKLFIDEIPIGIDKQEYACLKNKEFNSLAIMDSNFINMFIKNSCINFSKYSMIFMVSGDEKTLQTFKKEFGKNSIIEFPMEQKGLLTFYEGTMWFKCSSEHELSIITSYWGQGVWFELYYSSNLEQFINYIHKPEKQDFIQYLKYADLLLRQSGDADEIEIIFKKNDYNLISAEINEFVKTKVLYLRN